MQWFDPPETVYPRRDDKRMKEIDRQSDQFELSKIQTWLDLAAKVLDKPDGASKRKAKAATASASDVA
jgi:hypothetical protein